MACMWMDWRLGEGGMPRGPGSGDKMGGLHVPITRQSELVFTETADLSQVLGGDRAVLSWVLRRLCIHEAR